MSFIFSNNTFTRCLHVLSSVSFLDWFLLNFLFIMSCIFLLICILCNFWVDCRHREYCLGRSWIFLYSHVIKLVTQEQFNPFRSCLWVLLGATIGLELTVPPWLRENSAESSTWRTVNYEAPHSGWQKQDLFSALHELRILLPLVLSTVPSPNLVRFLTCKCLVPSWRLKGDPLQISGALFLGSSLLSCSLPWELQTPWSP